MANNLLNRKGISHKYDIYVERFYFVNDQDRIENHPEILDDIIDKNMEEEVDYWDDIGEDMPYEQHMIVEQIVREQYENNYVCHIHNTFCLYLN